MDSSQSGTRADGAERPRSMSKRRMLNLMLGAAGLVIAVGPCTFVGGAGWQEPLLGDIVSTDIDWTKYDGLGDLPQEWDSIR